MDSAPENIRLIAIDIDGTLLDPHKRLTERTREAVWAAQAAGIIVTLATARRYGNSRQFADELGLTGPLVTYDGALTVAHPQRTILAQQPLAADVAQQAEEIIARHRLQPIIHHFTSEAEQTWAGMPDLDHPELLSYFEDYPHIRRMPISELCIGHPAPLRIIAFGSNEAFAPILPELATLNCAWYTIQRGNYGTGELAVMNKECTKADGVLALARYLNIQCSQIMAIGDNINDLEMLQTVGWGVAMGHAPALVREVADAVTASNREDGAALAIERYALRGRMARYASSNSRSRAT